MSETLLDQIKEQGEVVRKLKAAKESAAKVRTGCDHFIKIFQSDVKCCVICFAIYVNQSIGDKSLSNSNKRRR